MTHTPTNTSHPRTATAGVAPGPASTVRLQPGQLAPLVLDHMRAHRHLDFSPYELGQALHRSHGSIRRHLQRLTSLGAVTRTQARPARFRITT